MPTLTSADGTRIAYEREGNGPAVVLVDGAMCYRASGPMRPIAALLKEHFTVYTYDRRGRGESGDTAPYAVAREIEDLRALVEVAGGGAYAFGMSSGGALVLSARAAGVPLTRLAIYEPPFLTDVDAGTAKKEYTGQLRELLDAGRNGDAAALFMAYVGMPAEVIAGLRAQPFWPVFEGIAPTLAYDDEVLGDGTVPRDTSAAVTVPTLLLSGGDSPTGLRDAAQVTADAIPGARHHVLDGQTHDVAADAVAPVLIRFLAG